MKEMGLEAKNLRQVKMTDSTGMVLKRIQETMEKIDENKISTRWGKKIRVRKGH